MNVLRFSDLSKPSRTTSAPVIAGPDDIPAYNITYIPSAPESTATPAPGSGSATPKSAANKKGAIATPLARSVKPTPSGTPRPSSPQPTQKTITVPEVSAEFIKSLHGSAHDFLGKEIDGAVISCPAWFTEEQRTALKAAAEEAGLKVLGLIDEAASVILAYQDRQRGVMSGNPDRISLVVDLGASSLTVTALSVKAGLIVPLASVLDPTVGGNKIDDLIISHFAKEFTKKTKLPLKLPAENPQDARAEAKLRLEVQHTKRTISAGKNSAPCNVESLKEGHDLHSTITSLRFDMLAAPVYKTVVERVKECLAKAGIDVLHVSEVLLAGASAALPYLKKELVNDIFGGDDDEDDEDDDATEVDDVEALLKKNRRTQVLNTIEPYEVVALGAVVHASVLASLPPEDKPAFDDTSALSKVRKTIKHIGLAFPQEDGSKSHVAVVYAHTPLPCRRIMRFRVDASKIKKIGFEIWEWEDKIEVRKNGELIDEAEEKEKQKAKAEADEDEDDEEDEPQITRTSIVQETTCLGAMALDLVTGKETMVAVMLEVSTEGAVEVKLQEVHSEAEPKVLNVPAP